MKTVMKKIVTAIASALMILLTVSCGSTSVGSNKLYGRWDAVGVNTDGAELTMDEVKAMGDDSMDNFYFIIKEGGKAYVHVQDEGELGDWEEIENGVKIGAMELVYEQEKLAVERNGIKVYFEKTSDDQTITGDNGNTKTDDTVNEENTEEKDEEETVAEEKKEDEPKEKSTNKDISDSKLTAATTVAETELSKGTGKEIQEGDFVAEILEDDTVMIIKYNTYDDECEGIPEEISGHTVSAIGKSAFSYKEFSSLIIPDTVKVIDDEAFYYTNIDGEIDLPVGVQINDKAFLGAKLPAEIVIPSNANVGKSAFAYADTEKVVLGENVNIGEEGFYYSEISELYFMSGSTIGEKAFFSCSNLEVIEGKESANGNDTSIEKQAFAYCDKLDSVNLPEYVTAIGEESFYYTKIREGLTISGSVSIGDKAFFSCESKGSLTIQDDSTIGEQAFAYLGKTEELTIGDNVTIDDEAFYYASDIASVTIGKNVEIGDGAFYSCGSMEDLAVAEGSSIGKKAFQYCSGIKNKEIAGDVSVRDDSF